MLNNPKIVLWVILFLLTQPLFAKEKTNLLPDSVYNRIVEIYAEAGKKELQKLMEQNAINDANGESYKNQYVFGFTEAVKTLALEPATEKYVLELNSTYLTSIENINGLLKKYNDIGYGTKKIYFGFDGTLSSVFLKKQIKFPATISSIDAVDVVTDEQKQGITAISNQLELLYNEIINKIGIDLTNSIGGQHIIYMGLFDILKSETELFTGSLIAKPYAQKSQFLRLHSSIVGLMTKVRDSYAKSADVFPKFASSDPEFKVNIERKVDELATKIRKAENNTLNNPVKEGVGRDFYDACRTGIYKAKGGSSVNGEKLIEVSNLLSEMMDTELYNLLLTSVNTYLTPSGKNLTDLDIINLKKSLEQFKEATTNRFGEYSTTFFKSFMSINNTPCDGKSFKDLISECKLISPCQWKDDTNPATPLLAGLIDGGFEFICTTVKAAGTLPDIAQFLGCWASMNSVFDGDCILIRYKTVEFWKNLDVSDSFSTIQTEVGNDIGTWFDNTFCNPINSNIQERNQCLYYQGKLLFDVGSSLLGTPIISNGAKFLDKSLHVTGFVKKITGKIASKIPANLKAVVSKVSGTAALYLTLNLATPVVGKTLVGELRNAGGNAIALVIKNSEKIISQELKTSAKTLITNAAGTATEAIEDISFETIKDGISKGVSKGILGELRAPINGTDWKIIFERIVDKINIRQMVVVGGVMTTGMAIGDSYSPPQNDPDDNDNLPCGCENKGLIIKQNFIALCDRLLPNDIGRRTVLRNLCTQSPAPNLENLSTYMNTNITNLNAFLDDIDHGSTGVCLTDPLKNHYAQLTEDHAKRWNWIVSSRANPTDFSNEIRDFALYQKLIQFGNSLTNFPLNNIVTIANNPPSGYERTVEGVTTRFINLYSKQYSYGGFYGCMVNTVDIIDRFLTNYRTITGSGYTVQETFQSDKKLVGGVFTMDVALSAPSAFEPPASGWGNLTAFEDSGTEDPETKFRGDIVFNNTVVETKNWLYSSYATYMSDIRFKNQFNNYISKITSLDQLAYVFKRRGKTLTDVKTKFQDFFRGTPNGSSFNYEIFDFLQLNNPALLTSLSVVNKLQFSQLVEVTSSNIYNFIKIK